MSCVPSGSRHSNPHLSRPDDDSSTIEELLIVDPPPTPSPRFMFLEKIFMPISFMSAWGWFRYFTFITAHVIVRWLIFFIPPIDPSGDLMKTSFTAVSHIATLVIYVQAIGLYAVYIIPYIARRKACREAKSFAPATQLRRQLTPFWWSTVRRPVGHLWGILLCALSAYAVRALEGERDPVLDPLRGAIVGAVWRVVFSVGRAQLYMSYPSLQEADEKGEYDLLCW